MSDASASRPLPLPGLSALLSPAPSLSPFLAPSPVLDPGPCTPEGLVRSVLTWSLWFWVPGSSPWCPGLYPWWGPWRYWWSLLVGRCARHPGVLAPLLSPGPHGQHHEKSSSLPPRSPGRHGYSLSLASRGSRLDARVGAPGQVGSSPSRCVLSHAPESGFVLRG